MSGKAKAAKPQKDIQTLECEVILEEWGESIKSFFVASHYIHAESVRIKNKDCQQVKE